MKWWVDRLQNLSLQIGILKVPIVPTELLKKTTLFFSLADVDKNSLSELESMKVHIEEGVER